MWSRDTQVCADVCRWHGRSSVLQDAPSIGLRHLNRCGKVNCCTVILKLDERKRLGELVARHVPIWTVVNADLTLLKKVADVVRLYVSMLISLINGLLKTHDERGFGTHAD